MPFQPTFLPRQVRVKIYGNDDKEDRTFLVATNQDSPAAAAIAIHDVVTAYSYGPADPGAMEIIVSAEIGLNRIYFTTLMKDDGGVSGAIEAVAQILSDFVTGESDLVEIAEEMV